VLATPKKKGASVTRTDDLSRHYSTLTDERIIELATLESQELEPDALQVLESEIRQRNLPGALVEAMKILEHGVPDDVQERLVAWYRRQPCPKCGDADGLLNAVLFEGAVNVYFVLELKRSSLYIACPRCLEHTFELWHVPALIEAAKQDEPTAELLEFVALNAAPLYFRMKTGQAAFEERDP
jgi:hypothetical protein